MNEHSCLYYDSEKSLLEFVVPFFKRGFIAHELCLWIVPQSLGVENAKAALCEKINGLNVYMEKGQFGLLDPADFYLKNGEFNPEYILDAFSRKTEYALKQGFTGFRVSGDASWVQEKEWAKLVAYEKAVDKFITQNKIAALCTYPAEKFDIGKLFTLSVSHGVTIRKQDGKTDVLMSRGVGSSYEIRKNSEDSPRE